MSIAKISILILFLPLLAVSCVSQQNPVINNYDTPLFISGKQIFVEIASTDLKRAHGLSGREKLKEDQGMLFVFETPDVYSFWMQNMKFDLDLIWIKNNPSTGSGLIVGITADVPHPKSSNYNLPFYSPPSPVDTVLEVNAGWSKKYEIQIGNEIKFEN